MSTRSITTVKDERGGTYASMYRQYDGYPEGHGKELAAFLAPITIINGISQGQDVLGRFANGPGCLAAQMVKHFKDAVGGIYLIPPGGTEEYNYTMTVYNDYTVMVEVRDRAEQLFFGDIDAFAAYCDRPEDDA